MPRTRGDELSRATLIATAELSASGAKVSQWGCFQSVRDQGTLTSTSHDQEGGQHET